jgi:hypothetical protein
VGVGDERARRTRAALRLPHGCLVAADVHVLRHVTPECPLPSIKTIVVDRRGRSATYPA